MTTKLNWKSGAVLAIFGLFSLVATSRGQDPLHLIQKGDHKSPVLLKIDDEEFTEEDLAADNRLNYGKLKLSEYKFRFDAMNRFLVKRLIGAKAKEAGMTYDEFVEKKIVGEQAPISEKEINDLAEQKKVPKEQLAERRENLIRRVREQKRSALISNYLSELTKKKKIEVYFSEPNLKIDLEWGDQPSFGDKGAPVTIVEFSDFQCPYCSGAAETMSAMKKKYEGKIRLAFRQFPLPMHRDARPAAEAALCVNAQGSEKFWKFHDLAFKNQRKLDSAHLQKYAVQAGVDVAKWKECFDRKKFSGAVQADFEYGQKIGVSGTPTFFVNGLLLQGISPEIFSAAIEKALQEKK